MSRFLLTVDGTGGAGPVRALSARLALLDSIAATGAGARRSPRAGIGVVGAGTGADAAVRPARAPLLFHSYPEAHIKLRGYW